MKYIPGFALVLIVFSCEVPSEPQIDDRFSISPNPAQNSVTIYVTNSVEGGFYTLNGYDPDGNVILAGTLVLSRDPTSFDVRITKTGTYRFTFEMNGIKSVKTIFCFPQ